MKQSRLILCAVSSVGKSANLINWRWRVQSPHGVLGVKVLPTPIDNFIELL